MERIATEESNQSIKLVKMEAILRMARDKLLIEREQRKSRRIDTLKEEVKSRIGIYKGSDDWQEN